MSEITSMGIITMVENKTDSDEEKEFKRKSKEGGEQKTDDTKRDYKGRKYCN